MILNMQANYGKDCVHYGTTGLLSTDNKKQIELDSQINLKLDYHQQSRSSDTKPCDDGIVTVCVKKQTYQSNKAEVALSEAGRSTSKVHNTRDCRTPLQSNCHTDLRLNSIPFTLQPSTDRSKKFDSCKNRIRKELARPSVTEVVPVALKHQNKCEKRTEAKVNYDIQLKIFKPRSFQEQEENLIRNREKNEALDVGKYEKVPKLRKLNPSFQRDSKEKEESYLQKPDLSPQSTEKVTNCTPNHAALDNCESSCHPQQVFRQEEAEGNTHTYIQNKVPAYAKKRYSNLKLRSVSNLHKNPQQYRSAVDLSRRELSRKEVLLEEHRTFNSRANQNGILLNKNLQQQQEAFDSEVGNSISPDKKRLCKSLSNLTAEDVLSVPCSSIFDRRRISVHATKAISQNGLNLESKQVTKTVTTDKPQLIQVTQLFRCKNILQNCLHVFFCEKRDYIAFWRRIIFVPEILLF